MQMDYQRKKEFRSIFTWLILFSFFSFVCIAWSAYTGKDLNWDSLNYHLYAGHQWSESRLSQDFLAASIQSYLNPLTYLPFYWMVKNNVSSIVIGSTLAFFHSLNLILVGWITSIFLHKSLKFRNYWIVCAAAIAAINPIFAYEIGSTFNDITTSVFVLAGYALFFQRMFTFSTQSAMRNNETPKCMWIISLSGILLGAASGFKLTNIIFPVALLISFLLLRNLRQFVLWLCVYLLGCILGFLIVNGAWAWKLYVLFGNPFFPYFNSVFESPNFPSFNIVNYRFSPESFTDALAFPVEALKPLPNIYTETAAPDSRFLIFFAILAVVSARSFYKRAVNRISTCSAENSTSLILKYFIWTWVIAYCLWLFTSSNGRYFLPGSLMLGPLIVCLCVHSFRSSRFINYFVLLLIFFQATQLMQGSMLRWAASEWTDKWFNVEAPTELKDHSFLYLTPDTLPLGFVIPSLHSKSSFANISGQVAISIEKAGGQNIQRMIDQHTPNIRSMYLIEYLDINGSPTDSKGRSLNHIAVAYDGIFRRFGLQTDISSCLTISLGDAVASRIIQKEKNQTKVEFGKKFPALALSCNLIPIVSENSHIKTLAPHIEMIFSKIESACPRRFSPIHTTTDRLETGWRRTYVNSDINLWITDKGAIKYIFYGESQAIEVGTVEDWKINRVLNIDCAVKSVSSKNYRPSTR